MGIHRQKFDPEPLCCLADRLACFQLGMALLGLIHAGLLLGGLVRNLGQYPVAGYGVAPYSLDWSPDGQMIVTPSQCFISTDADPATCNDRDRIDLSDPTRWLPRAWVRSFLSRQFAEDERPPFYTRRLSPGGGQIAYSLYDHPNQQSELYVFDRFTNSHRHLWTVSGYVINEIRWTNGEEFLVVGLGDRYIEGGPVILLVDASAAGPPQVLAEGKNLYLIDVIPRYPAVEAASPPGVDSPEPASTSTAGPAGLVVDIPGSDYGVVELSSLDWPACCPVMSPDGDRLAFATCHTMVQKILVQNVDGSGLKEINSLRTNDGDGACPDPAWSPDGRQLAFANYDYGLNVINANGTNLTRLQPAGLDPVWSPDGQQIAFTAHHFEKGLAIAVMNRDGSQVRLLTGYEAHDQRQAWSPDGQQIAFVSDRDGSDQRRLTDHEAQDLGSGLVPGWAARCLYL